MKKLALSAAVAVLSGAFAAAGAQAQNNQRMNHNNAVSGTSQPQANRKDAATDARQLVQDAAKTVAQFDNDPQFRNLAKGAKGIFVIPTLVRGSVIVGGQGGQGVLLAHNNGRWSDPAFFSLGSISVGLQAGGAAGHLAFLLMTDKALQAFTEENNFSLNANAHLTIVNYSAQKQGTVGKGDIIVYSDMKGFTGGVNVSGTDIVRNDKEMQNFYGRKVTVQEIVNGQVRNPAAQQLIGKLPA